MENDLQERTHNWGRKWTEDEDSRLLQAIEMFGGQEWKRISDHVGTREAVKCMQRWDKVLRPDLVKGKWTDAEDEQLRFYILQGFDHWGNISDKMPGRTAKQCRERWTNYLDPSLLRTAFTPQEDEMLLSLQKELGNKWAAISRQLPGRTENSVKLRYNALAKAIATGKPVPSNKSHRVYPSTSPSGLGINHSTRPLTASDAAQWVGQKRSRVESVEDFMPFDVRPRDNGRGHPMLMATQHPFEDMHTFYGAPQYPEILPPLMVQVREPAPLGPMGSVPVLHPFAVPEMRAYHPAHAALLEGFSSDA